MITTDDININEIKLTDNDLNKLSKSILEDSRSYYNRNYNTNRDNIVKHFIVYDYINNRVIYNPSQRFDFENIIYIEFLINNKNANKIHKIKNKLISYIDVMNNELLTIMMNFTFKSDDLTIFNYINGSIKEKINFLLLTPGYLNNRDILDELLLLDINNRNIYKVRRIVNSLSRNSFIKYKNDIDKITKYDEE